MLTKKLFYTLPFFITSSAFALNLQSYQFSESYRYALLTDSLKEKFEGKYVFTTSIAHVNSPFYYSDTYLHEFRREIIDSNQVLTAGFSYYLNERTAVGIDISGVHNKVFGESHTTFGDVILNSRFNLLKEETFSLSLNPKVYLPTGDEDNFSSIGSLGGSLSVVAEKSLNKLHLLASVGGFSASDNIYVDVDHRQLLLTQLGISYDLTDRFNLNIESYRNFPLVKDSYQDEGKYFLTGKHKTHERFSTYFGVGASGWGDLQRNSWGAFVGLKFHEKAPVAQAVALTAAAPQRQEVTPSEAIYFDHDRHQLRENEERKLDEYVRYMNSLQGQLEKVTLEGYASSPGLPDYNLRLSRKRANAVRDYLVNQGFPENIFSIRPFGEDHPQAPEEWKNRRVIFKINNQEVSL